MAWGEQGGSAGCGAQGEGRAAQRQVAVGLGGGHLDEVLQHLARLVPADAHPTRAAVALAAREGGRALERVLALAQLLMAALRGGEGGREGPAWLRLRAPAPPPLHQRPANKADDHRDRPGRRADGRHPHGRTARRPVVDGRVVRRGRRGRRRRVLDAAALARAAEVSQQLPTRQRAELKPPPARPTAAVVAALLGPRRWDGRSVRWQRRRRWRGRWKRWRWRRRRQRGWVVQAAAGAVAILERLEL